MSEQNPTLVVLEALAMHIHYLILLIRNQAESHNGCETKD